MKKLCILVTGNVYTIIITISFSLILPREKMFLILLTGATYTEIFWDDKVNPSVRSDLIVTALREVHSLCSIWVLRGHQISNYVSTEGIIYFYRQPVLATSKLSQLFLNHEKLSHARIHISIIKTVSETWEDRNRCYCMRPHQGGAILWGEA